MNLPLRIALVAVASTLLVAAPPKTTKPKPSEFVLGDEFPPVPEEHLRLSSVPFEPSPAVSM